MAVTSEAIRNKSGKLDFLYELYIKGVPLNQADINKLIQANYIDTQKSLKIKKDKDLLYQVMDTEFVTNDQRIADERIDVVLAGDLDDIFNTTSRHVILKTEAYDKLQETNLYQYLGGKEITSEDWMPRSVLEHTKDFIVWINSINSGFQSQVKYDKFAKYCQQSRNWLNDNQSVDDFFGDEKTEYMRQEFLRCKENTLYFMDKYLEIKEGDDSDGSMKYLSKPVHKILCYLIDCGYSIMAGKPRQIAATTTIGGIALKKLIFQKNFFIKFITMDKDTGTEIFEDKIKYPFGVLPEFLKPSVSNDRDNLFRLSKKTKEKGTKGGVNSKLQVVAPSYSAINGGAPQLVMIDEAGYIGILGKMMREGRPTMFKYNPATGKTEMKRQLVVWGTGGEMDKGGKAYENEFMDALDKWQKGEHSYGIIPLFFDWTSRPGITKSFYDAEKKNYTKEGPEKESSMVQFRQTYPSTITDMFLTSYKLLVGIDWINKQDERIKSVSHTYRPTKGYFEPIFDETKPGKETDVIPFAIKDVRFVPIDDEIGNYDLATVEIFIHPDKDWKYRYYQGTDPIASDNGHSMMSSTIWDSVYQAPVAILNYREQDYKKIYLQSLLLGMYYGVEDETTKDLVEINIGAAYVDFKQNNGKERSLVQRLELPDFLRTGTGLYGIDKRGMRTTFIRNKLSELLTMHGESIYFDVVFTQLRTYCVTLTEKGVETWGPSNKKTEWDDVLDSLVYSYICASCYSHREPVNLRKKKQEDRYSYELIRGKDGKLTRQKKLING